MSPMRLDRFAFGRDLRATDWCTAIDLAGLHHGTIRLIGHRPNHPVSRDRHSRRDHDHRPSPNLGQRPDPNRPNQNLDLPNPNLDRLDRSLAMTRRGLTARGRYAAAGDRSG